MELSELADELKRQAGGLNLYLSRVKEPDPAKVIARVERIKRLAALIEKTAVARRNTIR